MRSVLERQVQLGRLNTVDPCVVSPSGVRLTGMACIEAWYQVITTCDREGGVMMMLGG